MKKANNDDRSRELNLMVVLAQKGDPIAIEELCKIFLPLVQAQARVPMVRNLFGEDALNIVWLALLEVIRRKQAALGNVAGYVAMSLKFAVIEKVRKELSRRSRVCIEENIMLEQAKVEAEGLQALWEREEFLLEVRRLRPRFSKKELQVLDGLFKEGSNVRELAAKMDMKENAVRQTYDRALKKLRRLLKEDRV